MTRRPPSRSTASRPRRPRPAAKGGRSAPGVFPGAAPLRALVERSGEGMVLADEHAVITYANPACVALLGYQPAELVGRNGFDLCRAEHAAQARAQFARCIAHPEEIQSLQVDVQHGGGGFRTLAVTLSNCLHDPDIGAVVVHFHQAAAGPAESGPGHEDGGAEFRALFDNAPLGMGVADMDGNLLAFNGAIRQPGGYTREEILAIGNVSALYATPAERQRVLAIARKQGYLRREEVQFRSKDGTPYDTLLTLTPVQFRGRPCWFAVVEDITERKRAEAQRQELEAALRQAQKMEAVGRMTGGIAHDFNNLLTVILTSAELVASQLPVGAVDARRDLDELLAAARRGVATIRKLLGFSRQSTLRVAPTDLGQLVRSLEGMLRRLLGERIALEIDVAAPCTALVDPGTVEQMVMNLATNARDAMERKGVLRIAVRPVTLTAEQATTNALKAPGAFVRLSASDTGVGMDEHTRARALEPFFTTKPAGAGTGLGLAMVYGLVTQQNGFIEIESWPGRGTTVHLYFPGVSTA